MYNNYDAYAIKEYTKEMYNRSRSNLLMMIIFTLVNIIILFTGSGTMLLFSATVPYISAMMAYEFGRGPGGAVFMAVTGVCLISYLLCWRFSKKHYAWMIVALILFVIDTAALVGLYVLFRDFSGILDLLVHIWVLYYLVVGIRYGYNLKKMPDIVPCEEDVAPVQEEITEPMFPADTATKSRLLLEAKVNGRHICYRRIQHTNELVIDGYVYDMVAMLIEPPHVLSAKVDGHLFEAGYDGRYSYIKVDGEIVARKIRIF